MAARKKASRKRPAPKAKSKAKPRSTPRRRVLPNDEAWRELVATAVAKPTLTAQRPLKPRKAAKKK